MPNIAMPTLLMCQIRLTWPELNQSSQYQVFIAADGSREDGPFKNFRHPQTSYFSRKMVEKLGTNLNWARKSRPSRPLTKGITRIQLLSQASIAKRMSWVSRRKTTRTEDLAYCLLGIFDISMPLLYGEGDKAFFRLQEEIIKTSGDQSLFAWGYNQVDLESDEGLLSSETSHGPFVSYPSQFQHSGHIVPDELEPPTLAFTLNNMGLLMKKIRIVDHLSRFHCLVAVLACRSEKRWLWLIGIALRSHSEDNFTRLGLKTRLLLRRGEAANTPYRPVRFLINPLHLRPPPPRPIANKYSCIIRKVTNHFASGGLSIWNVDPLMRGSLTSEWFPFPRITIAISFYVSGERKEMVMQLF